MAVKMDMRVHPVADLFPMLPGSELQDLADDIKARGQLQPIVLDKDGAILDGRNRFAACNLAGVEPQFDTYDGDDPDGYALAVNISRRHMTKGQQALVVAKACLETRQPIREAAKTHGVIFQRISQANVILDFAPDLVDDILGGSGKFDAAYETAKQRKQEKLARAEDAESIREEAPDLADAVAEESITLDDAKEELQRRQEEEATAERVAAIEETFCGVEGHGRTFTERVEAEELTWAEAEKLAVDWQKEFRELVERSQRRAMEAAGPGWQTLLRIFQHDDALTKAVLKELTPGAKKYLDEIRADIIELAKEWEGQN